MRTFNCGRCGHRVYFGNVVCENCGAELGHHPELRRIVVIDETVRRCANLEIAACDWVLDVGEIAKLCLSCRLTRTRPVADDRAAVDAFRAAEAAKRRLVFQLLELDLPVKPRRPSGSTPRTDRDDGLAFDLLSSRDDPVTTGHANGLITLDLAESDPAHRAKVRAKLGEPYRTLLGHFRHESGHYYWRVAVERGLDLDRAREVFGDERSDYRGALQRHYRDGAPAGWEASYITGYASMHPAEDWAETFAHYLHIRDTLQTADAFEVSVLGRPSTLPLGPITIEALVQQWVPLTTAVNELNRSMGEPDAYPFVLVSAVIDKLRVVHEAIGLMKSGPLRSEDVERVAR